MGWTKWLLFLLHISWKIWHKGLTVKSPPEQIQPKVSIIFWKKCFFRIWNKSQFCRNGNQFRWYRNYRRTMFLRATKQSMKPLLPTPSEEKFLLDFISCFWHLLLPSHTFVFFLIISHSFSHFLRLFHTLCLWHFPYFLSLSNTYSHVINLLQILSYFLALDSVIHFLHL